MPVELANFFFWLKERANVDNCIIWERCGQPICVVINWETNAIINCYLLNKGPSGLTWAHSSCYAELIHRLGAHLGDGGFLLNGWLGIFFWGRQTRTSCWILWANPRFFLLLLWVDLKFSRGFWSIPQIFTQILNADPSPMRATTIQGVCRYAPIPTCV